MGSTDDNDTLPYEDAFDDDERELIISFLGSDMHGRWEKSKGIYEQLDIPAQLIMCDLIGHTVSQEIIDDIVNFFQESNDQASRK